MPSFTVVGIDRDTGAKGTLRVEATSRAEAMNFAIKKGLRVTDAELQEPRHPPTEPGKPAEPAPVDGVADLADVVEALQYERLVQIVSIGIIHAIMRLFVAWVGLVLALIGIGGIIASVDPSFALPGPLSLVGMGLAIGLAVAGVLLICITLFPSMKRTKKPTA